MTKLEIELLKLIKEYKELRCTDDYIRERILYKTNELLERVK